MKKNILLSITLAALIPMSAFAGVEVSNLELEGKVGIMGDTINDSNRNINVFDKDGTRFGGYAGLKVKGDITGTVDFGVSLTSVESFDYKNNIQGTEKNDAVLDEAYLKYRTSSTVFTVGRTKLDTPLLFSDTYRPISNSFDIVSVTNHSLKDTYLFAGSVFRKNTVDDLSFNKIKKSETDTSPLFILGGLFKGIETFPVQAWIYAQEGGTISTYISSDSKFTTDLNLGVQYSYIDFDNNVDIDAISMLGTNFSYSINPTWVVNLAYNYVGGINKDLTSIDINSINLSASRISSLYTSSRAAGEFMGFDESSIPGTSSFLVTAHGDLSEKIGKIALAFGTYNHSDGSQYNSKANTTMVGTLRWNKKFDEFFSMSAVAGIISYEVLDASLNNDRQTGQYYSLTANYSF